MRTLIALFASAGLAAAQAPIIGLWKLDASSGLTAADTGPFGNHASLVNFTNDPAQWVAGRFGNGLQLDGIDDYVDVPFNGGLPFFSGHGEAFSICLWVKGTPANDDRLLCLSSALSTQPLFSLGTGRTSLGNSDKLQVYLRSENITFLPRYSAATVFDDTWHHVAYTEHAGEAALYVDGVLDTASFRIDTGDETFAFDQLTLGAVLRTSLCCNFAGVIDEVQIYGYRLDASDIATIMTGSFAGGCRASFAEYGSGCGPGPFDLAVAGSPRLGGPGLLFSMRNGLPGTTAILLLGAGLPAPLELASVGFPGCRLYTAWPQLMAAGPLNAFGSSSSYLTMPIPNIAGLACVPLTFQAAAQAGAAGETSNAVVVLLGY